MNVRVIDFQGGTLMKLAEDLVQWRTSVLAALNPPESHSFIFRCFSCGFKCFCVI
jgi:hypothetical protein